jgi:hypothetical protein
LGGSSGFDASVFADAENAWIGLSIGGVASELAPVGMAPYAAWAAHAGDADTLAGLHPADFVRSIEGGALVLGGAGAACSSSADYGKVRWNGSNYQGCTSGGWLAFADAAALAGVTSSVTALSSTVSGLGGSLTTLTGTVGTTTSDIAALTSTVSGHASSIATLTTAVTTLQTNGTAGAVGGKQSFTGTVGPGGSLTGTLPSTPDQLFVSAWASFDAGATYRAVPVLAPAAGSYGHGNGQHGAFSGSGTWNQARAALSASATAGATTIQFSTAPAINAGELVLLLQVRGGNAGQWSIHRVAGRSSTSLSLDAPTTAAFDATGSAVAIAQRVPEYTTFTLANGSTIDAPAWDGTTGGVIAFYATGAVTINGTIHANGRGWRGGANSSSGSDYVFNAAGEGQLGLGLVRNVLSGLANGAAGGSGCGQSAGGGGSGATAGADGTAQGCYGSGSCSGQTLGAKGNTLGAATGALLFGGGGGASGSHNGGGRDGASGGAGGGAILINAGSVTIGSTGLVQANGANGVNGYYASSATQPIGGGGGGAGGTLRFEADNVSLGSTRVTATGGTGGISNNSGSCNPSGVGGDGGLGRVVAAGGVVTGTTSPATSSVSSSSDSGVVVTRSGANLSVTSSLPQSALIRLDVAY